MATRGVALGNRGVAKRQCKHGKRGAPCSGGIRTAGDRGDSVFGDAGDMKFRARAFSVVLAAAVGTTLVGCDSAEERAQAHLESGLALMEEGKPFQAQLEFRNAIKLQPENVTARYELVKFYKDTNNINGAVKVGPNYAALAKLYGQERKFADGSSASLADDEAFLAYVKQSIDQPNSQIVEAYQPGMTLGLGDKLEAEAPEPGLGYKAMAAFIKSLASE